MSTKMIYKKGFTLIELLVVISIIGVLSTVGLVMYQNAQVSARDHRRKLDLALIQQALELYYQDHKHYPLMNPDPGSAIDTSHAIANSWNYTAAEPTGAPGWINGLVPNYFSQIPSDPINNLIFLSCTWRTYRYKSQTETGCPAKGQWYALDASLENSHDPDALASKDVKWCNGQSVSANGGCANHLYIVVTK